MVAAVKVWALAIASGLTTVLATQRAIEFALTQPRPTPVAVLLLEVLAVLAVRLLDPLVLDLRAPSCRPGWRLHRSAFALTVTATAALSLRWRLA